MAHFRYLQTATRYGSAHYYVDDKQIIQTIGDSYIAWSVGDNQGYGKYLNGCTNANSISIEMCVNKNADPDLVYKNTLELTKNLMKKFGIPAERVCRHYDVSRKDCPHNLRANNWALWWQFKAEIVKPIEWKMDLSKSSTFGGVKKLNQAKMFIGDKEVKSPVVKNGTSFIYLEKSKIYVPIREFFETLGLKVDYVDKAIRVRL